MTDLHFADQVFNARADRTLFHPDTGSLLLSDLHLGKTAIFQRAGIPVCDARETDDLARLLAAIESTQAAEIWILGDLFHQVSAITESQMACWASLLSRAAVKINVILGNHDRSGEVLAERLGMAIYPEPTIRFGVELAHHPDPNTRRPRIAGHIHPQVCFRSRADQLVYPCFARPHAHELLLPAFTGFSGGPRFNPQQTDCFAITPLGVLPPHNMPPE